MKIQVDGKELFEINETQKKVIKNDIHSDIFDDDMKRRIHYILSHKYQRCFERLQQEWLPRLSKRVDSVPTDPDKFAELVFSQPDYKCKKTREAEKVAKEKINES